MQNLNAEQLKWLENVAVSSFTPLQHQIPSPEVAPEGRREKTASSILPFRLRLPLSEEFRLCLIRQEEMGPLIELEGGRCFRLSFLLLSSHCGGSRRSKRRRRLFVYPRSADVCSKCSAKMERQMNTSHGLQRC